MAHPVYMCVILSLSNKIFYVLFVIKIIPDCENIGQFENTLCFVHCNVVVVCGEILFGQVFKKNVRHDLPSP